jgi:hypothetical protein
MEVRRCEALTLKEIRAPAPEELHSLEGREKGGRWPCMIRVRRERRMPTEFFWSFMSPNYKFRVGSIY